MLSIVPTVCHSRSSTLTSQQPAPSSSQQISRDPRYPTHWWTPVPEAGKPDWEILPQEAGPGEVILSKRNELGLLSNFAATPFNFRGKRYASLEGFWVLKPDHHQEPSAPAAWRYYEILTQIRTDLQRQE